MTETERVESDLKSLDISMTTERTDRGNEDGWIYDGWRVVFIARGHGNMTIPFKMGIGNNGKAPTAYDVLNSLALETSMFHPSAVSFEFFCREFGWSIEEPKDRQKYMKNYKGCQREHEILERFFGKIAGKFPVTFSDNRHYTDAWEWLYDIN